MATSKVVSLMCGALALLIVPMLIVQPSHASTYVVYVPLDDPIYEQLSTLNGLGFLYTYLEEIKPISRVEAARLTLEAQRNLERSRANEPLAHALVQNLKAELADEVSWIETDTEDFQPTTIHPLERVEGQFIYSRGQRRFWDTGGQRSHIFLNATEGTPLLPNNDGIPTGSGSNEVLRWSGWGGLGGFLTGYGEIEASGPFTRSLSGSRVLPLGAEAVASMGNFALSIGQQEMGWGIGHFGALSQGNATSPFVAIRGQNIHPTLLPSFLRYLGQFRHQVFFGQLDGDRYNSHPWISGQIVSFKPVPNFEFGLTHVVTFGGRFNDNYGLTGFIGRAIGATGNGQSGNTNSRAGAFLKLRVSRLRNLEIYQEMLAEDNRPGTLGRLEPVKAVSYQGGIYLPRLTRDGRSDLRFEYVILEPNYSIHNDSLYWAYDGGLMGNPLGPNASEVDVATGRWVGNIKNPAKLAWDLFYTERAPGFGGVHYPVSIYGTDLTKEHSVGLGFDVTAFPRMHFRDALTSTHERIALEYVDAPNYARGHHSLRLVLMMSGALSMDQLRWVWR